MILVQDNFLPKEAFLDLQDYVSKSTFEIVESGEKKFNVINTPNFVNEFLKMDGMHLVLTFIRQAHKDFDTDLRIHPDYIINGHKTAYARVLYLTNNEDVSENGTQFWEHEKYGLELPNETTIDEFNRIIREDANDLSKWKKRDYVSSEPNRMVTYSSNYFHSRQPAVIEVGNRNVLVAFYAKKDKY